MSGVLRILLDRATRPFRRRNALALPGSPEDSEPRQLDIVLSELPPDWVSSLESGEPPTDYDVRSLGDPIDPVFPRR